MAHYIGECETVFQRLCVCMKEMTFAGVGVPVGRFKR
jgi:hypothetical protein